MAHLRQKIEHVVDVTAVFVLGIVYVALISAKTAAYYFRRWTSATIREIGGVADRLRSHVQAVR